MMHDDENDDDNDNNDDQALYRGTSSNVDFGYQN